LILLWLSQLGCCGPACRENIALLSGEAGVRSPPSPAFAYPRRCLGLADGQGNHQEASVVSRIVIPPDDLDHGGRAGAWQGHGGLLKRKAQKNRAWNRHDGTFWRGCALGSPWCTGCSFAAVSAHRSPVTSVPEDRKEGEARIRRGMASQRAQTTRRQRTNAFGQDRDHPGPASASRCRWDGGGLAQLQCARTGADRSTQDAARRVSLNRPSGVPSGGR
jgi:hypothetical protein